MSKSKKYYYATVVEEEKAEEMPWLSDADSDTPEQGVLLAARSHMSWILYLFMMATSIVFGGVIGYNLQANSAHYRNNFENTSVLSIYNGINFEPHMQRFNGSFFRRSPYSGEPTPEMDETWGRFTEAGSKWMPDYPPVLNVSIDDAYKSTSYPLETAVQLNDTQNIGYMASLGFFHQIHCLNMLRKFIHFDYYKGVDASWAEQPLLQQHADHCVDMLREVLMCHGDTSLIVYHWIKGYVDPTPDFSTMHSCRDPEAILEWMKKNQVKLSETVLKHGEIELPEIF